MDHNRYAPPNSVGIEAPAALPAQPAPPRPIAVWIFVVAGFLLLAFFVFAFGRSLWLIASSPGTLRDPLAFTVAIGWRLAIGFGAVIVLVGAFRGRAYARWIGLVMLLALVVLILTVKDTTHYANDAEAAGGFFARVIIIPALFLWWAHALALSGKAKRFFGKREGGG